MTTNKARGNSVNKFWSWVITAAVILLFGVSPFVVAAFTPSLTAAAATTYVAPSYQYNREWYDELGVVEYNDYLQDLQATTTLKTVTVAVVDSGLDYNSSSVFAGRVWTQYAKNFNLNEGRTAANWDQDESGHGTHVAGVIAAGSMANVQILPVRIFAGSDNTMNFDMFRKAINYVCDMQRALNIVAVNLSLGTPGITPEQDNFKVTYTADLVAYQPYINKLRTAGILPVAAAGNIDSTAGETEDKSYYAFPAACEGVVSVSAYYRDKGQAKRAYFSYYNERVSLSAPGVGIWSACCSALAPSADTTLIESPKGSGVYYYLNAKKHYVYVRPNTDTDGGTHYDVRMQGTSMATPFVALCYALLCSDPTRTTAAAWGVEWNANVDTAKPYYYLNPQHKALLLNATDFYLEDEVGQTDVYFGYGGVNIKAFAKGDVTTAVEKDPSDPSLPVYTPTEREYDEQVDNWASVFWILCGMIMVMTLIGFLRGQVINRRGQKNESE